MLINYSFDPEFDNLIENIKEKYPVEVLDIEGISDRRLDTVQFSKDFFTTKHTVDTSVDPNANVSEFSSILYQSEKFKPWDRLNSLYMLWKTLCKIENKETADKIIEHEVSGDIYINDLHGISPGLTYCFNYSTYDLVLSGLSMVKKINVVPPKHFTAFKSQLEQFIAIAANSTLGATGIADVLLVSSWFIEKMLINLRDDHFDFKDEESVWKYVESQFTSWIYTWNQPFRSGIQSPFTNVSVYDEIFLKKYQEDYVFPDGKHFNIEIAKKAQDIFLNCMNNELERTAFTFPVVTACFATDEENNIIDKDFLEMISKKNLKFGFINIYTGKSSTLSSCCRLRSDQDNEYFNSFGSGSSKIGSLGVVTINMPRLAKRTKMGEIDDIFEELKYFVEVAAKINYTKRSIAQKRIENSSLPLYTKGFMELSKQYSTVGINGFNEAIEISGYDPLDDKGVNFGLELINTVNEQNLVNQVKYGAPHNCEQIPAETVAVKLADKDFALGYNQEYALYSNQFIPLTTNADLLDRIRLNGIYDKHFSGGSICHLNVETKITDWTKMADLIQTSAKMGTIYFAINYNLQECENKHFTVGKSKHCPICNSEIINNYTRVVGFLINTKNFNKTRRQVDYPNRKFYDELIIKGDTF